LFSEERASHVVVWGQERGVEPGLLDFAHDVYHLQQKAEAKKAAEVSDPFLSVIKILGVNSAHSDQKNATNNANGREYLSLSHVLASRIVSSENFGNDLSSVLILNVSKHWSVVKDAIDDSSHTQLVGAHCDDHPYHSVLQHFSENVKHVNEVNYGCEENRVSD
jgi:hypothetical protein